MKVKAIAMIIGASLVASTAYAANQGEGKITFTGSITDAPCSIAAGSLDQVVPLGAVSNVALAANANTGVSTPQSFSIELKDCVIATKGAKDKVSVTFTGTASSYDATSLGLMGTAEGAYILMSQADGAKVALNTPTAARTAVNGTNNTLSFTAALKGGGKDAVIKPGSFQVPTNFVLTYQ
ncbi:fimbrial protein [Serratia fonticola]|uniref:fimbrial protein n=1 Tax=Serratia fonticola TaxID=47917 RepID=UPI001AE68439|nr:type 1 fimbrial protein [Serratia fonticola]MBP1000548.1 type 1 fimbrial protein [Serratia fonticola]MBP1005564.1 type 1 fimbrial protein [Serratia fonticola]MBP1015247.1 type 1 fimbrial protein [Serratia fonticola]MBP1020170.1 type 1 fimbrial protein [Serratia fonticola]